MDSDAIVEHAGLQRGPLKRCLRLLIGTNHILKNVFEISVVREGLNHVAVLDLQTGPREHLEPTPIPSHEQYQGMPHSAR